ncbi:hypothetical protein WQ54_10770 [Bacillus sp. SA1-12]|uniref:hypothetical protein n=1 Tax=Bacillus sp. SA1-12 TaxID=1455638 RepID=UPI0006250F45|nr:hypothetical protein [Bacillus sp. SA1-12]KKI92168.1 hypothetical protein WQ54_10770 [Bacillus sp. SA1-12]
MLNAHYIEFIRVLGLFFNEIFVDLSFFMTQSQEVERNLYIKDAPACYKSERNLFIIFFNKISKVLDITGLVKLFSRNKIKPNGSLSANLVQNQSETCIEKNLLIIFNPLRLMASRGYFFWCIFLRERHFTKYDFVILISTKETSTKSW